MKLSLKTAVFNWRLGGKPTPGVPLWGHTADEGLRPISPSKPKYPPHPSGRRY